MTVTFAFTAHIFSNMIPSIHGRIWAESDGVSKGTKVTVELPIK